MQDLQKQTVETNQIPSVTIEGDAGSVKSDKPCDICGDFRHISDDTSGKTLLYSSFYMIAKSAESGCILCSLVRNTALVYCDQLNLVTTRSLMLRVSLLDNIFIEGYEAVKPCQSESVEGFRYNARQRLFRSMLYVSPETPSAIQHIAIRSHISRNPLSHLTQTNLRDWLESCERHQQCCSSGATASPKRLVDVGHESDTTIKIITATEAHRYLALSHCWGSGKVPLRLTKTNEASMRRAIPHESLPQSFQDAIRVTRWLDSRYIWIDSLCIVQDDERNWEEESAKMAGIFGGCYLAIAASRASGCDEGFLRNRKGGQLVMCMTYQSMPLVVYTRDPDDHKFYEGAVPSALNELPLFKRGWCFQERLLAPRALHFAEDELYFQCRAEDKCECYGRNGWSRGVRCYHSYYATEVSNKNRQVHTSGMHDTVFSTTETRLENNNAALIRRIYDTYPLEDISAIMFGTVWGDIISDYSELSLTFDRDKLPALSGIASLILAYNPGRYLAGIWERDIHYLLAWRSSYQEKCIRSQETTVPSFSWASCIGQIDFPFECSMTDLCTVLVVKCDPSGVDPYGQVLPGGYIILLGKLISGSVEYSISSKGEWMGDIVLPTSYGLRLWPTFDTEDGMESFRQAHETKIYFFGLYRDIEHDDICAIVLRESAEYGTFKRVGLSEICIEDDFVEAPDVTVKII